MIKSTDSEVRLLIAALGQGDARREAAIARLTIIGERAVGRLIAELDAAPNRQTRIAILRVLEATGDDRALPAARHGVLEGGDVGVQAVAVLKELLGRGTLEQQAEALDALVQASEHPRLEHRVRVEARRAVHDVSTSLGAPVARDREPSLSDVDAVWADALDGHLPDDAATLRAALAAHAERAPLQALQGMIECIRARERSLGSNEDPDGRARHQWCGVRGALHQALALRGSRLALYDLRETLAVASDPLPSSFLGAVQIVGDFSCLEPLAVAHQRAAASGAWRHQLATAFHVVTRRERLTRRHAAVRRALIKSPGLETGTVTF